MCIDYPWYRKRRPYWVFQNSAGQLQPVFLCFFFNAMGIIVKRYLQGCCQEQHTLIVNIYIKLFSGCLPSDYG